jgi:hypothetical protein
LSPAIPFLLVVVAALALTGLAYGRIERLLPGAWLPALCRAGAWTAFGLLLLNPGCPVPGDDGRPLVLLDGSLSLTAAGGRWPEAARMAAELGDVRLFGDPDVVLDSVPVAGRSRLAPALDAAVATGRPVVVVTDGEIEDRMALTPASLRAATVRVLPRRAGPAAAVRAVTGPARVSERDTVRLRADLTAAGLPGPREVPVTVRAGEAIVARTTVTLPASGTAAVDLLILPGRLAAGDHVLRVGFADSVDAERRDDERLQAVSVSATPGIVVVASPGDWEARFLSRTLREVSRLPVEGFVALERGQWRRSRDLTPAPEQVVRRAVRQADLVILRGADEFREEARGRALLHWPSLTGLEEGDWYLTGAGGPVGGALAGLPLDSFPPAVALRMHVPRDADWVGLTAQAGRRGPVRPALSGGVRDGVRHVTIGVEGLWRWAFRGGSAEQGYRALVANLVDWLLAQPDTLRGVARPLRTVVPRGMPLTFERAAGDSRPSTSVRLTAGDGAVRVDTLVWDGAGRARIRLEPGVYAWAAEDGGRGTVAVEAWSEEWFPRPVVLEDQDGARPVVTASRGMRERPWLYAVLAAMLGTEWFVRRRRGLR